jgi:hypothetical protein
MKKNLKTLMAVAALATFPVLLFAQTKQSGYNLTKKYSPGASASYTTGNEPKLEFRNDIPVRAIRNFIARFNEVTNLHWYTFEEGFIAKFIADSIETRVVFDTKGFWSETINTYSEENMPAVIKNIVEYSYRDFNVIVAHKIETPTASWYIVKIENETKLKTLQIKNGEMEIIADFVKE